MKGLLCPLYAILLRHWAEEYEMKNIPLLYLKIARAIFVLYVFDSELLDSEFATRVHLFFLYINSKLKHNIVNMNKILN